MNTKLEYMYRDADNYKESETVIFSGKLTRVQIKNIFGNCEGDNTFIPQQVGLEPLYPRLQRFDSKDWDVDHPWHELLSIEPTKEEPTSEVTATEFYQKFMNVDKWDDSFKVSHILNKR